MVYKLFITLTLFFGAKNLLAQEPSLPKKDISLEKKYIGDQQVYEYGWKEMSVTGTAKVISDALVINCDSAQLYSFRAVQKSKVGFNPTGSFTVEFKAKVLNSNGRGLDVSFKTRSFSSPTIYFSHKYVGVASPRSVLSKINGNNFNTYRIAVSKENGKIYIYANSKYLGSVDFTSLQGSTPYLSFGKGHKATKAEIHLESIAIDQTGAFRP